MTTNRGKLEQLSNKKLTAFILDNARCGMCIYDNNKCSKLQCFDGIMSWLNQESED